MSSDLDARVIAIRRHADFRQAVELHARECLSQSDRQTPALEWLTRDRGRAALLSRLFIRYAKTGNVTASYLSDLTRKRGTSSSGRALSLVKRIEAAGLIQIEPGAGHWTERNLNPTPELFEAFRGRAKTEIRAAALVTPGLSPLIELLGDDGYFKGFMTALGAFDPVPSATRGPATPSIQHFLNSDGGLMVLCDLLLRQPPERERLFQEAPFVRAHLADRFAISRVHINRMFARAEEAGYLSVDKDRIRFSPLMSQEAEHHYALTFLVIAYAALAAHQLFSAAGA